MIRNWWAPEGYTGYNEVLAPEHGYGPYNFITYLPYVIFSFLTGVNSHNYVFYCNIIMTILSLLVLVYFSKMSIPQSVATSIFLSTFLIADYYIFSGMSEPAHIAFTITIFGLMIRLYKSADNLKPKEERAIIWTVIILIIIFGIIRPYQFVFIVFPLIYIFAKMKGKKKKYTIAVSTLVVFAFWFYFYSANNYGSPYFIKFDSFSYYFDFIANGQISELLSVIVEKNINILKIIKFIKTGSWEAAIILSLVCLQLLLMVHIVFQCKRKERNMFLFFNISLLLASIAICEANILLYSSEQMVRMLLGIIILIGLSLCVQIRGCYRFISFTPTLCISLAILLIANGTVFILPQDTGQYQPIDDAIIRNEFETLMPLTDDHWDHTIAFEPPHLEFYMMYLFPSYLGLQCCFHEYLIENVNAHTLKSKYVWANEGSGLDKACQNAGLEKIWARNHWCIYATR